MYIRYEVISILSLYSVYLLDYNVYYLLYL